MLDIRSALNSQVECGYATGVVALTAHGDRTEVVVLGRQGLGHAPQMERDSIFRMTSMTKPVVAAATLMLIEDGKLSLDAPIERWLPELANRRVLPRLASPLDDAVPAIRSITVEDLLSFRLGWGLVLAAPGTYPIQRELERLQLPGFGPPDPASRYTPDTWLEQLGRLPLMAQPGQRWMYNTGSYVLGVLIARASGQSLPAFLDERLFAPLGMRDTGFFVPEEKRHRLVDAHNFVGAELRVFESAAQSAWSQMPTFPDGGAGLVSTADDFLAFSRFILAGGRVGGKQLLSERAIDAMTRDHLNPEQHVGNEPILAANCGWGYGVCVVTRPSPDGVPTGAYGWTGGYGSSWWAERRTQTTAILLTQTLFNSPEPLAIHTDYWRLALAN
jgi:CubicO group peptidase (beta-lactamase class C family)